MNVELWTRVLVIFQRTNSKLTAHNFTATPYLISNHGRLKLGDQIIDGKVNFVNREEVANNYCPTY